MASITIRNLEDTLKTRLRVRAASHRRSMEEEAREILRSALATTHRQEQDLAATIQGRFAPLGGFELELPRRDPLRDPPDFSK